MQAHDKLQCLRKKIRKVQTPDTFWGVVLSSPIAYLPLYTHQPFGVSAAFTPHQAAAGVVAVRFENGTSLTVSVASSI